MESFLVTVEAAPEEEEEAEAEEEADATLLLPEMAKWLESWVLVASSSRVILQP